MEDNVWTSDANGFPGGRTEGGRLVELGNKLWFLAGKTSNRKKVYTFSLTDGWETEEDDLAEDYRLGVAIKFNE